MQLEPEEHSLQFAEHERHLVPSEYYPAGHVMAVQFVPDEFIWNPAEHEQTPELSVIVVLLHFVHLVALLQALQPVEHARHLSPDA